MEIMDLSDCSHEFRHFFEQSFKTDLAESRREERRRYGYKYTPPEEEA